jgi:glyoxylase-like metal-dependent hydrolase (beta-lactamase superfamily II)
VQTEALARELVDRVRKSTGHTVHDVNVFRNLGRFVVSADATFIRELVAQPEITAALANRRPPDQRLQT